MLCSCPPDWLCERCLANGVEQLAGCAWSRGFTWADSVAQRTSTNEPWPATPRARQLAERKVEDLTPDPRLRARLADQVEAGARERWAAGSTRAWREGIAERWASHLRV